MSALISNEATADTRRTEESIRRSFELFCDGVVEIRAFDGSGYIHSGYFDNAEDFTKAAKRQDAADRSAYVTLNPVHSALLARRNNNVKKLGRRDSATPDKHILRRRWLLVDCDPERPADIPSSAEEKFAAWDKAREIKTALELRGISGIVEADSSNGHHLLIPVNLPNDHQSTELIKGVLEALDLLYGDKAVKIDTGVFNASRITKLYGTTPRKGDGTEDRPHRPSCLLNVPENLQPNPRELLEALAAERPEPDQNEQPRESNSNSSNGSLEPLDVPEFISKHDIEILREGTWNGPGVWANSHKWIVPCAWQGHTDYSCHIIQATSGVISARCKHDSCQGRNWQDFRTVYEPDAYTRSRETASKPENASNDSKFQTPISPEANPLLAGLVNLVAMIENGVEDPEELEPGILLKGRVHHIFAPAAVGKTYLAIWFAARQIKQGRRVLYMDAENGARIFTERLKAMGCKTEDISKYLSYLPFPTLDMSAAGIANYSALIEHTNPALVIFDSWIKFLSSAGLAENENDDIARWAASFLQPIRNADITSVVLDHVPHEGNRSRGASRKRDEVDVQYSLIKTQKFDRATVGEIRLKLEKDREGWLPEFTTFSIGGGKDGFVFERSSGTVAGPGQIILKSREKEAFEILAGEFGEAGARHNEWLKACERKGISRTTFRRARDELIRGQAVRREEDTSGPLYFPALVPTGARGGGPDFSPYITVIPDRGQQGPHRGHEPDGTKEGPQGPPSLESGPLAPAHEPGANDEIIERVEQALEFGNAPKKALENYRSGDQDIDSVVRSVMHYHARGRDDIERWRAPVIAVVGERATSSAPSAPRDEPDDSAGGLGGYLRRIRDEQRAEKGGGS